MECGGAVLCRHTCRYRHEDDRASAGRWLLVARCGIRARQPQHSHGYACRARVLRLRRQSDLDVLHLKVGERGVDTRHVTEAQPAGATATESARPHPLVVVQLLLLGFLIGVLAGVGASHVVEREQATVVGCTLEVLGGSGPGGRATYAEALFYGTSPECAQDYLDNELDDLRDRAARRERQ